MAIYLNNGLTHKLILSTDLCIECNVKPAPALKQYWMRDNVSLLRGIVRTMHNDVMNDTRLAFCFLNTCFKYVH